MQRCDDEADICYVFLSFSYGAKVNLAELSRIMGLPGKPDWVDGNQVKLTSTMAVFRGNWIDRFGHAGSRRRRG
ncbi:hypothetical protein ACFIOY_05470 [Bradyrhizobium sp. TZ2]